MPTNENCLAQKITRKPFQKAKRTEFPLLNSFGYLWSNECKGKVWCYIFHYIYDDFTRFGYFCLISHKSEALECFKRYLNEV